ncbi:MAG TPA: SnoaL-like domain-containing protein [Chitinophagaceae bacterium]
MKTQSIETSLRDLNQLVIEGKPMEAFEKYYHEDVAMQENGNAPVIGKEANRKRELEFFANVQEFRNASVKGLAVGNETSFVIWSYDYTHKEWGVRNYTQVSVQNWKDGKIINEQFFYGN